MSKAVYVTSYHKQSQHGLTKADKKSYIASHLKPRNILGVSCVYYIAVFDIVSFLYR